VTVEIDYIFAMSLNEARHRDDRIGDPTIACHACDAEI
jgi:hypothetical protein